MGFLTRRTFLRGTGIGVLAATSGCSDLLGGDPVTVQYTLTEVGDDVDPITEGEEREIDPGGAFMDEFEVVETTKVAYTVEVLEGPSIDVFVLDGENLSAFDADEDFEALEASLSTNVNFVEEPGLELEPDSYALVLDNGYAEPENA